jgi:hypothetical protein
VTEENPHAERLLRLRQSVAEEYGIDVNDWRVRRLALFLSLHADAEDRNATGKTVDIGDLLELDRAIEEIRQSLKAAEPTNITVRIAEGLVGICPRCKAEIPDYTPPPKPPAPPPTKPEPPPVVVKPPAPAPAAPARPTRERRVAASGVSPLSFDGGYDPGRGSYGSGLPRDLNPYRKGTDQ